jgi:hypothetical protein
VAIVSKSVEIKLSKPFRHLSRLMRITSANIDAGSKRAWVETRLVKRRESSRAHAHDQPELKQSVLFQLWCVAARDLANPAEEL